MVVPVGLCLSPMAFLPWPAPFVSRSWGVLDLLILVLKFLEFCPSSRSPLRISLGFPFWVFAFALGFWGPCVPLSAVFVGFGGYSFPLVCLRQVVCVPCSFSWQCCLLCCSGLRCTQWVLGGTCFVWLDWVFLLPEVLPS